MECGMQKKGEAFMRVKVALHIATKGGGSTLHEFSLYQIEGVDHRLEGGDFIKKKMKGRIRGSSKDQ